MLLETSANVTSLNTYPRTSVQTTLELQTVRFSRVNYATKMLHAL